MGRSNANEVSTLKPKISVDKHLFGVGVGLGAIAAAEIAFLGTACPLCIVGAPACIALSVKKRNDSSTSKELMKQKNLRTKC